MQGAQTGDTEDLAERTLFITSLKGLNHDYIFEIIQNVTPWTVRKIGDMLQVVTCISYNNNLIVYTDRVYTSNLFSIVAVENAWQVWHSHNILKICVRLSRHDTERFTLNVV